MKTATHLFVTACVLLSIVASVPTFAEEYDHSTPGISGYDPVAYFSDGKPVRGSGYHAAVVDGVTYVFASSDHQEMFEANPEKYLPAYGGYCAYGLGAGKKFVADPEVWRIVEGKLYLNLNKRIQEKWEKDIPGFIKKGDANWSVMTNKKPSDL